ncbi:hypothetical protein QG034_07360 [Kingella kingae]|uniref:hypothetical protein n=1 Tax=Kingella kingae TaxID=504 RepID=UPI00050A1D55|nr:hypothetical protein [Kingella kingae]MDK4526736.1 hypothetical protein [Kingella kingae]MDK4532759.1 hypothetical protein [Kingella kingae]
MPLKIPKTSKQRYISDVVALNIHSPNGTGDWHSATTFASPLPEHLFVYGDAQPCNTNPILGDMGIIDGTKRLNQMGIYPEHTPVFVADHPRACFDLIYTVVLQKGAVNSVILDDWFPSTEDKQAVYAFIQAAEPHFNSQQKERLVKWKQKNPIQ